MNSKPSLPCFIGSAGWSISKENKPLFPIGSSLLASYAQCFNAVEINSSFYRPHNPLTYEKWAASVPPDFRFAVKTPRRITHEKRLNDVSLLTSEFLSQVSHLGEKLGVILVQLPPSLIFNSVLISEFLRLVRSEYSGNVAIEPRHLTWFTENAKTAIDKYGCSFVMADPSPVLSDFDFSTRLKFQYIRLHGAPKIYYSNYEPSALQKFALQIHLELFKGKEVWCVFDNTASGCAIKNAFELKKLVKETMSF